MSDAIIQYLTTVRFGTGALQHLPDVLRDLSIERPLVVTDAVLRELGFVDRLGVTVAAIFDGVETNPTEESVDAGLSVFNEADCDGIVVIGGGSPIDCAKCISLRVTHPGPLEQYAVIRGGLTRISADKPPLVAIPTTAGTGSEVGRAALVTVANGTKLGVISPHMIPSVAICDPELTLDLPPSLTAATGMDAISHCVETFCSPKFNPVADAIALDGFARAWAQLPQALATPRDPDPRSEMMMASLQGGLTFQKGLGLIHSLSHPMGALPGRPLHHGMLNAVFLPHVLEFNAGADGGAIDRLAGSVGLKDAAELVDASRRLVGDLGLPTTLGEMGVDGSELGDVPDAAVADHSTPSNPRAVTAEDCAAVLRAAL